MEKENIESLFPPKPEEPHQSDCCGTGCNPCVFDIYQKQLSDWEKQCNLILSNQELHMNIDFKQDDLLLSQIKFTPFQLISVEQHAHNTFLYTFQAVKAKSDLEAVIENKEFIHVKGPLGLIIGQHLMLKGRNLEDNTVINRAYTPISDSELHKIGCFKILVKLYKDGKMSNFIRTLKENDITDWRGPYGEYHYLPNSYRFLLMFCAGTGVAPIYPIAKSIVTNDSDDTFIHLFFACQDFEDILLRNEMQELAQYWNFSAMIFLSQARNLETRVRYNEKIKKGRIDKDVVNKEIEGKNLNDVFVLICGTKPFNKDMVGYLRQCGLPDDNIHLF